MVYSPLTWSQTKRKGLNNVTLDASIKTLRCCVIFGMRTPQPSCLLEYLSTCLG